MKIQTYLEYDFILYVWLVDSQEWRRHMGRARVHDQAVFVDWQEYEWERNSFSHANNAFQQ